MVKKSVSICFALLLGVLLVSCQNQSPRVQDYYPITEDEKYSYVGAGNEYASYTVVTDYAAENKVQRRIDNGGTVRVEVVEVSDGKVSRVFGQPETYYRENFLEKESNLQEVLLMEPIVEGTSWELADGSVRTITGVSVPVETPSGDYSAVAVETEGETGKTIDYYAKDVGLVKSVAIGDGYEVSAELSERLDNTPFVQPVRFYYPNGSEARIYYKDKEVSFRTNDEPAAVLAASYQEDFAGKPGDVFSPGTKINSCYLNQDDVVCLDLSREFLTGMNAGAAYEALILQCMANTFGSYYQQNKMALTIDGAPYASGHFELKPGEYLTVNLEKAEEIK